MADQGDARQTSCASARARPPANSSLASRCATCRASSSFLSRSSRSPSPGAPQRCRAHSEHMPERFDRDVVRSVDAAASARCCGGRSSAAAAAPASETRRPRGSCRGTQVDACRTPDDRPHPWDRRSRAGRSIWLMAHRPGRALVTFAVILLDGRSRGHPRRRRTPSAGRAAGRQFPVSRQTGCRSPPIGGQVVRSSRGAAIYR